MTPPDVDQKLSTDGGGVLTGVLEGLTGVLEGLTVEVEDVTLWPDDNWGVWANFGLSAFCFSCRHLARRFLNHTCGKISFLDLFI